MCDQQRLRPACAYAQSGQSLCQSLEYSMTLKLLTDRHLEFLSLKGGITGSSESTLVKCHIVGNHMSRLICFIRFSAGIKKEDRTDLVILELFAWFVPLNYLMYFYVKKIFYP